MSGPAAGWFPDPLGRHEARYWDGNAWTAHVSDAGQVTTDPLFAEADHAAPAHADVQAGHPEPQPAPPATPQTPPAYVPAAVPVAPPKSNKTPLLIGAAVLAVVAIVGAFLFLSGGDDDETASEAEIFLEAVEEPGPDPFTDSVDTNTAPQPARLIGPSLFNQGSSTTTSAPGSTSTTAANSAVIRTVPATAPGLYGGTRNNAACDVEQMISFLQANPEKAAAWAAVQQITVAELPAYLRSLTPVVLRADTRVTNHGYRDGRATPRQAVLQAGTAVLVDQYGIPRAKCGCGNPLTPPQPQSSGTLTGNPWPGFQQNNVIVVVNTTNVVINQFVLVDLNGGYIGRKPPVEGGDPTDGDVYVDYLCDLFPEAPECQPTVETTTTIPEPVLGTGDIQFTLRWSSTADLDLAVTDPLGERIDYGQTTVASGGQLDVDSNAACTSPVSNPVENIFWPEGMSPDGVYTIEVSYYSECEGGSGPQPFTITALIDGVPVALTPIPNSLRQNSGQVDSPGQTVQFQVEKTPGGPTNTLPPTTTTVPSTVPPPTGEPIESPPNAPPVTEEPMTLEEYCRSIWGQDAQIGPEYPGYTLCMHDPTV